MPPKSKRPKKNMQNYTKEDMTEAVRVVNEGMHSISEVACMFNIPRKTLCDRVHGNHQGSIGAQTTLTGEEEGYLVNYIQYMAKRCFPLSISQIRGFAWAIVLRSDRRKQFTNSGPTEKWWRGFKKRNQASITLRTPDNLDRGRGCMANQIVLDRHFETLKALMIRIGV